VAGQPAGDLPRRLSLAAAPRPAILTAAKAGTADDDALVLRLYQPTNAPLRVVIRTAARRRFPLHGRLVVEGMTALEVPLPAKRVATLEGGQGASRFSVLTRRALTTVAIRAEEPR